MVNKYLALFGILVMSMPVAFAVVVKGTVSLVDDYPTAQEYVAIYDKPSVTNLQQALAEADKLYAPYAEDDHGHKHLLPDNVEVELQTLPDFNVIGRAKVDAKGRYRMEVKEDDRDWRVFCKCAADGPGGRFEYLATKHVEWEPYAKAYVQNLVLRRDYTSVAGRCVDKAGQPIADAVVRVTAIKADPEGNRWCGQVTRTGKDGMWRVDGMPTPFFRDLMTYLCDTNSIHRSIIALRGMPYEIEACAHLNYGVSKPSGSVSVANVSADSRMIMERAIAGATRITGKKVSLRAPLTDFPASTNNVIYVPDIVLE